MKVQLKKIKICHNLSEETTAYTAVLYIDGHKAAFARNDGRGGCDLYDPYDVKGRDLVRKAEAHFAQTTASLSDGTSFPGSLETEVARLLDHYETKRNLQREFRKGFLCIDGDTLYLHPFSNPRWPLKPGTPAWQNAITRIRAQHPGSVVLNELPIDEAVSRALAVSA